MAAFAEYEEEVKECLSKVKTLNAAGAASQIAEARDMLQQVPVVERPSTVFLRISPSLNTSILVVVLP
jgi:hypothetical protein